MTRIDKHIRLGQMRYFAVIASPAAVKARRSNLFRMEEIASSLKRTPRNDTNRECDPLWIVQDSVSSRRGFTLIELVMVIILVGLLGGIAAPLTLELIDSFSFSIYRREISSAGESALRRLERDIRRLRNATSVLTANAATYRFIDVNGQTIQFSLSGNNLLRFDGVNTDVLAAQVSAFSYQYFDESMTAIAAPTVSPAATNIKFVQINISFSSGTHTLNYTTLIRTRNILQQSDLFTYRSFAVKYHLVSLRGAFFATKQSNPFNHRRFIG